MPIPALRSCNCTHLFPASMSALFVAWSGRVGQLAALPSLQVCCRPWGGFRRPALRPARRSTVSNTNAVLNASDRQPGAEAEVNSAQRQPLDEEEFGRMLDKLKAWKDQYYECIVPRKVHDATDLGEWVHRVRQQRRRGQLLPEAVSQLDNVGFKWEVDPITAKWYHNLHAARLFKEVHGSGDIPPGYSEPSHPDWVEAGRWLERQRDLYRRQKLLLVRVRLLKEVLGVKLQREHSRPRRNMHPVLKQGNAEFRAEQRQRQKQQQQEQEQGGNVQKQQRQKQRQPRRQPAVQTGSGGDRQQQQEEPQQAE